MTAMEGAAPETLTVLPDPALFRTARMAQRVCILVAAAAVFVGVFRLLSGNASSIAVARASLPVLMTGLLCAASMLVSEPNRTGIAFLYARGAGRILVIFGAAVSVFWMRAIAAAANPLHTAAQPSLIVVGFVLLALTVVLVDNASWLVNRAVDALVCVLCLLSLLTVSNALFSWFGLFGKTASNHGSAAVLVCLIALTAAVALRQAEHGVLSIFLGVGMGSKLARIFAPILLILSFLWQALNAKFAGQASAALLGALAVAVAVGILLFFAWRISRMENEIHDLVLRDEATRLFNQRGFFMLAEHALRLAKRADVPFSVLFIELKNLTMVHEEFGPEAAAASLGEAGEILRATFRESDIKGRIGADEFAVAGRFDRAGISVAAMRLEAATAARTSKTQGPVPLRFSMGHVTTADSAAQENLKDLLTRAGHEKNRMDLEMKEVRVN